MDGIDVIYWINMDKSTERRYLMEDMLTNEVFINIPNNRITGIDGNNPKNITNKLGLDFVKQEHVTNSEYGCLLSHLDAINEFNNSEHEIALILDDEVTLEFQKYWQTDIRTVINEAPADWEIIMLWYNVCNGRFIDQKYANFNSDSFYYALSYIINKKGSSRLISEHKKNDKYVLCTIINHISDQYLYQKLNTYVYKFPFFVYRDEIDSNIHVDHLRIHIYHKENAIEAYESLQKFQQENQ